jgi:glycine/D-amino acid oxidase-like deaminating enzyme
VVIVGAGLFGAAAALELRARGACVTLVDVGPVPGEAASSTDVSKMVRMDYGSDVFYHELGEAALAGWDTWNRDWPRPLYHETGFLILARGAMQPGRFEHDSFRVLGERGYRPERTGGGALSTRWPEWRGEAFPDGYFNPRAGWAESGEVVARLVALAVEAGVELRADGFAALVEERKRVVGVRTRSGETLRAEHVLVCAGAWAPVLLPELRGLLRPVAQPVLHFHVDDVERFRGERFPAFAADIAGSGWYGFPALSDGRVKLGHHGPGREVDPDRRGAVDEGHVDLARSFFAEAIPALADAPLVGRRICMYCDSFDGDLWIDHDPARPGLVIAAGGSGHGFKFAPLLGPLVADVVERRQNRWARRFSWRALGAPRAEEARHTETER